MELGFPRNEDEKVGQLSRWTLGWKFGVQQDDPLRFLECFLWVSFLPAIAGFELDLSLSIQCGRLPSYQCLIGAM